MMVVKVGVRERSKGDEKV
jgi:hypothetical protein